MPRTFKRSLKFIFLSAFLLLFFSFGISLKAALAQTSASPQFLITWKTSGSYIPSFYEGKALPTYGSQITASLELVSQNKIADLSSQTIYWYLDDTQIGGGTGIQHITFPPFGQAPNLMTLKVVLPDYNGAYLIDTIQIPMVQPQAVIYAPYTNGTFSQNPVLVTALPYFFNISSPSDLSFTWSVNGQSASNTENPEEAEITIPQGTPSGTSVAVALTIKNSGDSTVATANQTLTYQSQL